MEPSGVSRELEPLAIASLIEQRGRELGLRPSELVRRAGYRNVTKGLRRLDELSAGEFSRTKDLIRGLPRALEVPEHIVGEAVARDSEMLKAEREAAWRAAFTPHAIAVTGRRRPEPIFVAVFTNATTYMRTELDLTASPATFFDQGLRGLRRHHLDWLKAEGERRKWGEPLWLFPSAQNTPLDYSRMADEYRATLKATGLVGFTPYSMRHTYAALRLSAGAPPKWVSGQLGHRDLTTTLRFYDEWVPRKGETYADILESKIIEAAAPVPAIPEPDSRTKAEAAADWDSELADLTGEKSGAGGGS